MLVGLLALCITVWPYPTAIPLGWLAWSRPVMTGCLIVGDSQPSIDFALYIPCFLCSKAILPPHPAGNHVAQYLPRLFGEPVGRNWLGGCLVGWLVGRGSSMPFSGWQKLLKIHRPKRWPLLQIPYRLYETVQRPNL